jgi:hypothetical protein
MPAPHRRPQRRRRRLRAAATVLVAGFALALVPRTSVAVAAATGTHTTLSSSAATSSYLDPLTLTATVVTDDGGTATGTVTFSDGTTQLGTETVGPSGVASYASSALRGGGHSIAAVYSGDASYTGSTSPVAAQVVNARALTVTLDSPGDHTDANQQVLLLSRVRPNTPAMSASFASDPGEPNHGNGDGGYTGADTLLNAGGFLDTGAVVRVTRRDAAGDPTHDLSWSVWLAPPLHGKLHVGTYTNAQHRVAGSDDPNAPHFGISYSVFHVPCDTTGGFTVNSLESDASGAVTDIDASFEQHCNGSPAALRGHVHASRVAAPGGPVRFSDGSTSLGSQSADDTLEARQWPSLAPGTHNLTAAIDASADYAATTSTPLSLRVLPIPSVTVNSSPTPGDLGQPVTLTATVAPVGSQPTPTGDVDFSADGSHLGSATLDQGGTATLATSALNAGDHPIGVLYTGDLNYGRSSGSTSESVRQATVSVQLSSSLNPSQFGEMLGMTATLTPATTSHPLTGMVSFYDGATSLGFMTVGHDNTATVQRSSLTPGSHTITARYQGDPNVAAAASSAITQLVVPRSTTVLLVPSSNPSVPGQRVTLATDVATDIDSSIPTGTVSFQDGSQDLGSVAVGPDGTSTLTVTLPAGVHSITAVYGGDSTHQGSTSDTDTQMVADATPNGRFVNQLYNDILGRPADGSAVSWASALDQHRTDRTHVALALTSSTEYLTGLIQAAYRFHLGRDADADGLRYWLGYIRGGGTFEQLDVSFIGAPEYYINAGGTPDGYLDALYRDAFGRTPDDGGRSFWDGRLAHGTPQWQVAMAMVTSVEAMRNRVGDDYLLLLGRTADMPGRDSWVQRLLSGTRDETLLGYLAGSDEYWNLTQAI